MASTINASTTSTTGLVYTADASGELQLQSDGTTGLTVGAGGNVTVNTNLFVSGAEVEPLVRGNLQTTTTGTTINFTGIPSWVKRITIIYNGVSTSGTSPLLVRIGSGSIVSTGYLSTGTGYGTTSGGSAAFTNGFATEDLSVAAALRYGQSTLLNITGNTWIFSSVISQGGSIGSRWGGGSLALAGVLDRITLTASNGTDTFDAGSVNIMYE